MSITSFKSLKSRRRKNVIVKRTAVSCWIFSVAVLLVGSCLYVIAWVSEAGQLSPNLSPMDDLVDDHNHPRTTANSKNYLRNQQTSYENADSVPEDEDRLIEEVYDDWWKTLTPQVSLLLRQVPIEVFQFQLAEILFKNKTFYCKNDISDAKYMER